MRILLAFDKFKDSMSAAQACAAAARGVRAAVRDAAIDAVALTDGGDGFLDAVGAALGAETFAVRARDPLLRPLEARIGMVDTPGLASFGIPAGKLAIVEMAAASGLMRLGCDERDPTATTSRGTGEMLVAAAERRPAAIVLGVGGSATNDLGLGALEALGLRAIDSRGKAMENIVPGDWPRAARIEFARRAAMPPIFIACDVTNPLLGEHGATATFGPQKGLPARRVGDVDREAGRIAGLLLEATGAAKSLPDEPGGGAAGGIAFGLRAALGARLIAGFDFFAACARLDERMAHADAVVAGEGRFDATSLRGKGPGEIVRRALAAEKRVAVACGAIDDEVRAWLGDRGVTAITLVGRAPSREASMRHGARLLEEAMRDWWAKAVRGA